MRILLLLALAQPMEDLQRHRNLGAAYYERGEYSLALSELEKALAFDAVAGRDYFNLGMACLQDRQEDRALSAFTTAGQMEPGLLEVDFGLGVLHKRAFRYPLALEAFRRVAARDPEDPGTWFHIGAVAASMRRGEDAEESFRRVLDLGHRRGQNFYVSALFRYATLLAQRGRTEEAQERFAEFETLRARTPNVALTETALENGRYARVAPPRSPAPPTASVVTDAKPRRETVILATGCENGLGLALGDYDGDGRTDAFATVRCGGNRLLRNVGGGKFEDVTEAMRVSASRSGRGALFLDDESSGAPSLYVWTEAGHHLYKNEGGRFVDRSVPAGIAELPPPALAIAQDLDSDGQLDLLLAGPGKRLQVLRNQGDGTFSPSSAVGLDAPPLAIAAADFDQDGFADAFVALDSGEALVLENEGGAFRASPPAVGTVEANGATWVQAADLDGDGWMDVQVSSGESFLNRRGRLHELEAAPRRSSTMDLDGDGTLEELVAGRDGTLRFSDARRAHILRIALEGKRTNRQAVGATVELKAGRFYRKEIYPGYALTFPTPGLERVDVVRVTWTNGVIQNLIDVASGQNLRVEEEDRQTSSCPFLYVWDGHRFRFLTDVVGRAPLGEILPDGSLLTPNPEDRVRIPPGAMKEREGKLVFQVTEELRELALLDAVELLAVDHPRSVEVYTSERFSSPPFEPSRWYPVSKREAPLKATTVRGEDVLGQLLDADGDYVSGFDRDRVPGFAEEHALILTAPTVPEGSPLWLFLSGFVYWPSSSSMRALSGNGRLAPEAPRLEVKDASGEWVTAIADLGLPSGIDRTLVADLSRAFHSSDRRVRVVTNFAVYWDHAFFGEPATLTRISTRSLKPIAADLHYRGFSQVGTEEGKPERYDYDRLLPEAPWNAAAGLYTRYGDVRESIWERDGRLVVMAPGDEMTLVFDPGELPGLESGEERSYFLQFRGWAKDQDPNTRSSRTVEPLPETSQDDPLRTRRVPALVPPLSLPRRTEEEPEGPSLGGALTGGTPSVHLRYRYELVDDGAFVKRAHASTLRSVLGYRSLPFRGFSFFLQAQNVAAMGEDRFDNRGAGPRSNGVMDRPAVVDPSQTRMQQVYGRFEGLDTTLDVGRREIAYGDHRFVGDVNWRQNHQALDAIHLVNRSLPKTTLSYTFAGRVLRIDGGTKDMSSHLLNATIALDRELSLELYSYLLDYDDAVDASLSSQSYGGKIAGSRTLLGTRVLFEAHYAKQLEFGANPFERNPGYLHLLGGIALSGNLTLKLGRELLGGTPENGAFQTPLATLFKWNGWADRFLTTPANGLVDWYASAEGRLRSLGWSAAYHDFRADAGGARYGSELDARAVVSTGWKQSIGFQVALYREAGFATDAGKLWLWTEYGF